MHVQPDCRRDTSLCFWQEIRDALVTKAFPEDRHWASNGGKLVTVWLMRKVTGLQNKKGGMMSFVWGFLYQCKTILVWFAVIWFVSVCVIWCVGHSQGKDLLPLQLQSSSIINTVRNHCGPCWPSIPWCCWRHSGKMTRAGQCIVCVSLWKYAFNVSKHIHSFCS